MCQATMNGIKEVVSKYIKYIKKKTAKWRCFNTAKRFSTVTMEKCFPWSPALPPNGWPPTEQAWGLVG